MHSNAWLFREVIPYLSKHLGKAFPKWRKIIPYLLHKGNWRIQFTYMLEFSQAPKITMFKENEWWARLAVYERQ